MLTLPHQFNDLRGCGYKLRFRPSGVLDQIISMQRLSFCFRHSLSSQWIFSITITFRSTIKLFGKATSELFLVSAGPTDRKSQIFWKILFGGCGYIYWKYTCWHKNILTFCMWRNGVCWFEIFYVFLRTQAVSSVLPKICTKDREGCLTLGLRFVSNANRVSLQCQTCSSLSPNDLVHL